jgi:hypothetical protein
MDALPALRVLVRGEVTETNVDRWAEVARAVLGSINRTLNTDQDFADAENAIKWCGKQEAALAAAKEHALSQTESIDKLFKTIDAISEETRTIRLEQEKLVGRRKVERRDELVSEAVAGFHKHVADLNSGLAPYRLPVIAADFAAQVKGKRNFASMSNAIDTELSRLRISSDTLFRKLKSNIDTINANTDYLFLFNDAATLIGKEPEDLGAIIENRITAHKAAKEKAEADQREKIRLEEEKKAQDAAQARAQETLRLEREAQAARDLEAAAKIAREADEADHVAQRGKYAPEPAPAPSPAAESYTSSIGLIDRATGEILQPMESANIDGGIVTNLSGTPAPVQGRRVYGGGYISHSPRTIHASDVTDASPIGGPVADVPGTTTASDTGASDEPATLNLTAINERFGGALVVSAASLALLGIHPADSARNAKLYRESQWLLICSAIVKHVNESRTLIPF